MLSTGQALHVDFKGQMEVLHLWLLPWLSVDKVFHMPAPVSESMRILKDPYCEESDEKEE